MITTRVTGLGGVFFNVANPDEVKRWYHEHLGFVTTQWGASFIWGDTDIKKKTEGRTEWSPFKEGHDYFAPSKVPYMFNYRVANLDQLLDTLAKEGVTVVGEPQKFEYGGFGWIMDPEGRKVELWEPIDGMFGDDPQPWPGPVTGIGAVYFKSADPQKLVAWYKQHLGFGDQTFRWRDLTQPESKRHAHTLWAPFRETSAYFDPGDKPYLFNYRVKQLLPLLDSLKEKGVQVVGDIKEQPYGRFGWIIDPFGTKVELWEPNDEGFPA